MTKPKNPSDPSPHPDMAKKPCTEAARGADSVASRRKAEDLPTLMSVSPFAGWSPFKKFMVISSKGSAKVADRSPFKIHRELKSILGDETIEVTKLGSGDLMVELKSNDQAKKLGAIATFLDIPVTVSYHKSLNSTKGVIRSHDLRCCLEEEMVEELSGVTHARRFKVRRGEDKIQTDIVLTFDSPKPPSRIRAGYLTLDVRPYVPMCCYKCQRYGHGKDRCKKPAAVCVRCGKGDHVEGDCSADPHCVNCRGDHAASSKTCPKFLEEQAILRYKAENGELKLLLNRSQSAVVALQECRLWEGQVPPRGYTLLLPRGGSPWGEVALLIRNGTRFSEIDLKTDLHAAAATISLEKTLTVCSLYLPPNSPLSKPSLAELFEQLPKPFLVLGDFNAHSPAWGDSRRDGRGRMLEEFIAENDFIILNSGEQTFVHSAYHSTSAIDLAVASPSIAAECSWAAHSDLCERPMQTVFG
ncbi:RNA-directed DNA polymerase from mobile element jockey [Plakobranchus ocellatus]|uniref:RNA-directed DNA polymerase from mobile element jockey n=1 Tax=Plakobranchus ocellatus TaxID=259542 RepID=A0AAV4B3M8_9GAST|nr:RNA-directed DNA polymerase from mobile element jockey [Plakobranchus ocellatus]